MLEGITDTSQLVKISSKKSYSRYYNTETLQDENYNNIIGLFNKINLEVTNDASTYITSKVDENRLDIISEACYGTPRYYWLIALANNIIDPFVVPPNTTLYIPPINAHLTETR